MENLTDFIASCGFYDQHNPSIQPQTRSY